KLLRLHDGERGRDEAEALERELSAEEREKLAALDELGGLVRGTLSAEAEEAKLDLWAGLEGKLAPRRPALGPRRRVWASVMTVATLAAAAAALVLLQPGMVPAQTNHCVVESLEVAGGAAMVLQVPDE